MSSSEKLELSWRTFRRKTFSYFIQFWNISLHFFISKKNMNFQYLKQIFSSSRFSKPNMEYTRWTSTRNFPISFAHAVGAEIQKKNDCLSTQNSKSFLNGLNSDWIQLISFHAFRTYCRQFGFANSANRLELFWASEHLYRIYIMYI